MTICMCSGDSRDQNSSFDPLELKLQAVVRDLELTVGLTAEPFNQSFMTSF